MEKPLEERLENRLSHLEGKMGESKTTKLKIYDAILSDTCLIWLFGLASVVIIGLHNTINSDILPLLFGLGSYSAITPLWYFTEGPKLKQHIRELKDVNKNICRYKTELRELYGLQKLENMPYDPEWDDECD